MPNDSPQPRIPEGTPSVLVKHGDRHIFDGREWVVDTIKLADDLRDAKCTLLLVVNKP